MRCVDVNQLYNYSYLISLHGYYAVNDIQYFYNTATFNVKLYVCLDKVKSRVHNVEESFLLQYGLPKINSSSTMYGFSTNITPLKGVNKQDWNSV